MVSRMILTNITKSSRLYYGMCIWLYKVIELRRLVVLLQILISVINLFVSHLVAFYLLDVFLCRLNSIIRPKRRKRWLLSSHDIIVQVFAFLVSILKKRTNIFIVLCVFSVK